MNLKGGIIGGVIGTVIAMMISVTVGYLLQLKEPIELSIIGFYSALSAAVSVTNSGVYIYERRRKAAR